MKILGISAYYHDSAIALLDNDRIVFALQEERLSRIKADSAFPKLAITKGLEYLSQEMACEMKDQVAPNTNGGGGGKYPK